MSILTQTVALGGTQFDVFTYRPAGEINGLLLTFHGDSRDANGMRNAAISIADQMGYFVVAPLFDEARFGDSNAYQRGGIVLNGKFVTDRDDWTIARAKEFADWGATAAGLDTNDPIVLFGHSAGGQFLSRVAAYSSDDNFDRMIIANPSTYAWPSLSEKAPYGFGGGYFSQTESEALLQDYLADPITIFLGGEDTGMEDLAVGSAAMRQGENRLERGLNVYTEAKAIAEARGWEFNWDLVLAPGIGHTAGGMLRSSSMLDAIKAHTPILVTADVVQSPALTSTAAEGALTDDTKNDVLWGIGSKDQVTEKSNEGIDTIRTALANYSLPSNVEVLEYTGMKSFVGTGNALDNTIIGGKGDDTLNGGAGNDMLDGGAGKNKLVGGTGNDTYVVNSSKDQVTEKSNEGIDTIRTALANYSLPSNVEVLEYTGMKSFVGNGNALDNTIIGGKGDDIINGGSGNDTLWGLGGADQFVFNTALSSKNIDTIMDFDPAQDKILLENSIFKALTKTGNLAAGAFNTGSAASQADDHIIYNNNTGALLYDADGTGRIEAIHFATLDANLMLSSSNFLIV